ncbi:DUF3422 family protein [Pseudidiomarina sp. GXY010]|uniref:DUF3422 family protein n=1 Tax=Pseudidiomarina fusca TaxID=2965078 RepID=A0ABU3L0S6_9GAMM|nr:DUF3422 family protein [Pseudidiomarina sp. GXY010]MDT7526872.1 DUF3422 family protein [Pseudidiomarina sp. GXY010]
MKIGPTATVYGMPAYADRAAAVGEVHARPHLLLQAPRGILQLAFMTEGDQTRDQMAMSELSHRFGVAEPDHATPLHGMTWDEGNLHCEKYTEFSTYLWCASLDNRHTAVNQKALLRVPDILPLSLAAALPCPLMTAWQAIEKIPRMPEADVLITGAGGMVGRFLVQPAVQRNYRVTAMASARHHKTLRQLASTKVSG